MSEISLPADTYNLFPASPTNHVMHFSRMPHLSYVIQQVNLPGISTEPVVIKAAGMNIHQPATAVTYDPLTVHFLVDEEFSTHRELQRWLLGVSGGPDRTRLVQEFIDDQTRFTFPELSTADTLGRLATTTAGLTVVNGAKIPILRFLFYNVILTEVGPVEFSTTTVDTTVPLTSTATFKYDWYTSVELKR